MGTGEGRSSYLLLHNRPRVVLPCPPLVQHCATPSAPPATQSCPHRWHIWYYTRKQHTSQSMHEGSGSQSIGLRDHSPGCSALLQGCSLFRIRLPVISSAMQCMYHITYAIISTYMYVRLLLSTYQHRRSVCSFTVEPLYRGHHWDPTSVLYREASLIQRQIFTQLYVVGTADTVLIREVCLI